MDATPLEEAQARSAETQVRQDQPRRRRATHPHGRVARQWFFIGAHPFSIQPQLTLVRRKTDEADDNDDEEEEEEDESSRRANGTASKPTSAKPCPYLPACSPAGNRGLLQAPE